MVINSIKSQFFLMINKKYFWFSFYIVLGYVLLSCIVSVFSCSGIDLANIYSSESWFIANSANDKLVYLQYFRTIYPLLISIVFGLSYYDDTKSGAIVFICSRNSKKEYWISKTVVGFLGGFIIIFVPYIIDIIINAIIYKFNDFLSQGVLLSTDFNFSMLTWNLSGFKNIDEIFLYGKYTVPFARLYINHTLTYIIMFTLFISCFSGLMSVFSIAFSTFVKKYKIIILVPVYFIFYIGQTLDTMLTDYEYSLDLFNYLCMDISYTKNYLLLIFFSVVIALLSFVLIKRDINKDIL